MLVLGIDQSLTCTGVFWFGSVEEGWCEIEPGSRRGADRLLFIRNEFLETLSGRKPDLVALEGYSYASRGKVFELGEVGGVIKMTLAQLHIPHIVVAPVQVKKFATGHTTAEKEDMVAAMNQRFQYNWALEKHNVADAAALACVAEAYLLPDTTKTRPQLEVIAALTAGLNNRTTKKTRRRKKRIHSI
jgi:crossover junction endodeoxyribonuclease RuvC